MGLLGVRTQGTHTKPENSADLAHYFSGVAKFCSIMELERVNVSPELAFHWENFLVNLKVQNPGGEVFQLRKVSKKIVMVDTSMSWTREGPFRFVKECKRENRYKHCEIL